MENESNRYEYETSQNITIPLPTKQNIINCLSPQGHWVTSQPDIQVEPVKKTSYCFVHVTKSTPKYFL